MFQALSTAYSVELDAMTARGQGFTNMSKRYFFKLFKLAFDQTFTEEKIRYAFAKPGIWPVYRHDMIRAVTTSPSPKPARRSGPRSPKTPANAPQLRQLQIAYARDPSEGLVAKLFNAVEMANTKAAILFHDNEGLREAIKLEKQMGRRVRSLILAASPIQGRFSSLQRR